jgi:hypothetical protein
LQTVRIFSRNNVTRESLATFFLDKAYGAAAGYRAGLSRLRSGRTHGILLPCEKWLANCGTLGTDEDELGRSRFRRAEESNSAAFTIVERSILAVGFAQWVSDAHRPDRACLGRAMIGRVTLFLAGASKKRDR